MFTSILAFSRDRAMQLDAVLRSFFLHCQHCEQAPIFVLYRATLGVHARQYETLKDAYPGVNFIEQDNFRDDVLRILSPYTTGSLVGWSFTVLSWLISLLIALEKMPFRILQSAIMRVRVHILGNLVPKHNDDGHILFLVDDNLFVRDFSFTDITNALLDHPDSLGFSLRLGRNITNCYTVDLPQSQPNFIPVYKGINKYNWTTSELDFGYPLEISSSMYRSRDIFPLLAKHPFKNPNELEYQLANSANAFFKQMPFLLCSEQSFAFCNPLNLVQESKTNRASTSDEYTSEHLANLFEQGYRVDVDYYDGFVPESCHQEVPLKYYLPESGADR